MKSIIIGTVFSLCVWSANIFAAEKIQLPEGWDYFEEPTEASRSDNCNVTIKSIVFSTSNEALTARVDRANDLIEEKLLLKLREEYETVSATDENCDYSSYQEVKITNVIGSLIVLKLDGTINNGSPRLEYISNSIAIDLGTGELMTSAKLFKEDSLSEVLAVILNELKQLEGFDESQSYKYWSKSIKSFNDLNNVSFDPKALVFSWPSGEMMPPDRRFPWFYLKIPYEKFEGLIR